MGERATVTENRRNAAGFSGVLGNSSQQRCERFTFLLPSEPISGLQGWPVRFWQFGVATPLFSRKNE